MKIKSLIGLLTISGTILAGGIAFGQVAVPPPTFVPLNQIPVPTPPNLFKYVKNKPAAIILGKAFFWDMQVGSDGIQACASCHFHAGADNRMKNTLNPDTRASSTTPGCPAGTGDCTFQVRKPNETLLPTDFPFHQRQNPDFQNSPVIRDANDVVGSQGVHFTQFTGINLGLALDSGTTITDPVFNLDQPGTDPARNQRRVTARNTPTNINAVFNFSNFWDGRAHFTFNGVNPFGPLDTTAGVWFLDPVLGLVKKNIATDPTLRLEFASLASQATGPPLDNTEMSYGGRTFPKLGQKMLSLTPLGKQIVHPRDSVLGPLSKATLDPVTGKITGSPGINASYSQMIMDAFANNLWDSPGLTIPDGSTQMEANFSLFWGLAIQLYESTLVSDQTPFDRFLGGDTSALTIEQQHGFNLFFGGAVGCNACHLGTELTNASVGAAAFVTNAGNALIEQMTVAAGGSIIYDSGFNDTAVRPITDDIGRGGNTPFNNPLTLQPLPLSFCALAELQAVNNLPFGPPPNATPVMPANLATNFPIANNGNFKVPGLRNVELTAPYMHDGGMMTLNDVVDFYTRGGNFPAANASSLDVAIIQIGALQNNPTNAAQLVALMKSFTDERVRNESAPFDHPELFVPNLDPNIAAPDVLTKVPAKDAFGNAAPAIALTLNQVPSITNNPNLPISGVNETGATVEVKVNNGAPIAATVTGAAWTATIPLTAGVNNVTVTATQGINAFTVTHAITLRPADGCFNCGGVVGITDAIKALRIAVGLVTATADDMLRGDVAPLVNGVPAPDGRIDVSDAMVVLKKAVGLVSF